MAERYKIITERHTIADLTRATLVQLSTGVDFSPWRFLYTDGASILTELALGAQYTVLQSGGASAAPSFGLLTNSNIAASGVANVAWNKLAAGTASAALRTGAAGYPEVVPVNATATNKFLRQVSSGAPSFETLSASDIPALSYAPAWSGLTVGSILYASAATTVGEITAVAAGRFLVSNGAGTAPFYEDSAKILWTTATSDLTIAGNYKLPTTTTTAGALYIGTNPFLHAYGTSNTFLGESAGNRTLSGAIANTGLGAAALQKITSGDYNVSVGMYAGYWLQQGSLNVDIGYGAGNTYQISYPNSNSKLHISSYTGGNERCLINGDFATGGLSLGSYAYTFVAPPANGLIVADDVGVGTSAPTTRLHIYDEKAANTEVMDVLTIDRGVTGAGVGASGLGAGIALRLETDSAATMHEAGRINAVWEDATNGYEASKLDFGVVSGGTPATRMSLSSAGTLLVGDSAPATPGRICASLADTTGVIVDIMTFVRRSSAAPSSNFGAIVPFYLDDDTHTLACSCAFGTRWEDPSHASPKGSFTIYTNDGTGASDSLTINADKTLTIAGKYTLPATDAPNDGDVLTGHHDGTVTWETPTGGSGGDADTLDTYHAAAFGLLASANAWTAAQTVSIADATTNTVLDALTIDRGVSGAGVGAANLGVGVPLRLENASGTVTEAARINAIWTDATNTTENGELSLWVKNDGTARKLIRTTATGKYYDWIFAANAHDDEFAWSFETNGIRRFQCDVSGTNGAAFRIVPRTDAGAWKTPAVFITRSNGYVGILNYGPSYPLHVTGDINSTTGYRTNGTPGLSATYNVAGTAGSGTLKTMTFSGGILTGVTTW